ALAGIAHACVDVSDGLLADLGHICVASGVGATLRVDALPASDALRALGVDSGCMRRWQATGGDDYELCFTAAVAQRDEIERALSSLGVACTRIGGIEPGSGVRVEDRDHGHWQPDN